MHVVYDPTTGADVTSTVQAALISSNSIVITESFWIQYINPNQNTTTPTNLFRTSAAFPYKVTVMQQFPGSTGTRSVNATFLPSRISRGSFEYEVGFKDSTCDITWYLDDIVTLPSSPWGIKWAVLAGYFNEMQVWIHQAFFSDTIQRGGTLLGTTLKWRGFIRGATGDREKLVIHVASLMDVFQTIQVPTQTIQPGNRFPPYYPAGNASVIGGSLGGFFLTVSSPMDIMYDTTASPFAGIPDHFLRDVYITSYNAVPPAWKTAQSAQPFPPAFRIRDNVTVAGILHIYPYEPIDPVSMIANIPGSPGGVVYVNFFQQQQTGSDATTAKGFSAVPSPETGL